MIRFATGLPLPPFNGAMRTRLDEGTVDRAIEQSAEYFTAKKLPWTWYQRLGFREYCRLRQFVWVDANE